jgi:hypothetical protein
LQELPSPFSLIGRVILKSGDDDIVGKGEAGADNDGATRVDDVRRR